MPLFAANAAHVALSLLSSRLRGVSAASNEIKSQNKWNGSSVFVLYYNAAAIYYEK